MGTQRLIPSSIVVPDPPTRPEGLLLWARGMGRALDTAFRQLGDRMEAIVIEGTAAQRPPASGTRRFYFARDTMFLYYDDGTWQPVSVAVPGAPFVSLQATYPGTVQSGGFNVDGVGQAQLRDKGGQVFNVKAYGAVGDGTTDDTAAINAAITAAAAASTSARSVQILFPHGTYKTTGGHVITGIHGLTIAGSGVGATLIEIAHASNTLFSWASGELRDLTLRDFSVTSTTVTRTGGWVLAGPSSGTLRRSRVERLDVKKQTNGIWLPQFQFVWFNDLMMTNFKAPSAGNNYAVRLGQLGVAGNQGSEAYLNSCAIFGGDYVGSDPIAIDYGIFAENSDAIYTNECSVGGMLQSDLKITAESGHTVKDHFFNNTVFDATKNSHAAHLTGAGVLNYIRFVGCWFGSAGNLEAPPVAADGLRVDATTVGRISVSGGSRFLLNQGTGLYVQSTGGAPMLVVGNDFEANGGANAANHKDSIFVDVGLNSLAPHIVGNRCVGVGGTGVSIRTGANTNLVTVIGNAFAAGSAYGIACNSFLNVGLTEAVPFGFGGTGGTATLTGGSIPYSDGGKLTQDNAKLFWDATNKRIGLNINASLLAQLHQVMPSSTEIARIVKAAASHTANLDEWRDSANAVQSEVDAKGSLRTLESARVAPWIEPEVVCTGDTTIDTTTSTDITGATVTFTPKSDCRIQVTAFFDVLTAAYSGDTFIGELKVNGTAEGEVALFDPRQVTVRMMVGQVWNLTLTGGTSYTIKLAARMATDAGTSYSVLNSHTKFSIVGVGRF